MPASILLTLFIGAAPMPIVLPTPDTAPPPSQEDPWDGTPPPLDDLIPDDLIPDLP